MGSTRLASIVTTIACCLWAAANGFGQITSVQGDGVLNAPYRGTVKSLRNATLDLAYGEVRTHVEPNSSNANYKIQGSTVEIWVDVAGGSEPWDRSVLRLFQGVDATGAEIDLTGINTEFDAITIPAESNGFNGNYNRFTFKAIGTKTLATLTYRIKFRYRAGTSSPGSTTTPTRIIKVAPMTASFLDLPGESEAYHFGVPLLDISVGNAGLTVPTGRTADMIGAAFMDRDNGVGPASGMAISEVLMPGAGESQFLPEDSQFDLSTNVLGFKKTDWGSPWYLPRVGFYVDGPDVYGPDGTQWDGPASPTTSGVIDDIFRLNFIRPFRLNTTHPATQSYLYAGGTSSVQVTEIRDGASPSNVITLTRSGGDVVRISTSDGRGWDILSDPVTGHITGIEPDSGQGARYFSHHATGRVSEVRDANNNVMYAYQFDADGDLVAEQRYVDGNLETAIAHQVVSDGLRQRFEYPGTNGGADFRRYDLEYDTTSVPVPGGGMAMNRLHRLVSITSYRDMNAGGPAYTTTYTHDFENADGTVALTHVDLPDGTEIDYEYDAPEVFGSNSNFGLRTKTTRTGPVDGTLVTQDREYEFFYDDGGDTRLFFTPRVVRQRDGRGGISEVVLDYEDGATDENSDGLNGQESNQLLSRTGPPITLGTSGARTPEIVYTYNTDSSDIGKRGTLLRQQTAYAAGPLYRTVEYGYDLLLRMTSQVVDPSGENIVTQYQYVDNLPTQDRITIDADNFYFCTKYDNDGRVATTERFLNAGAATGQVYTTSNMHDVDGRLYQQIIDNKEQDGASLSPATLVTQFAYDRLGRLLLRTVDPGGIGQESNFDYNWLGDIEREFDTTGRGVARTYDGRGLVVTETPLAINETPDANLTSTFTYDALGNLRFIDRPTGTQTERVYDDFARLEQEIRHPINTLIYGPITTTFEYDAASHVTRTYVDENSVVLSDSTAKFDEGGFNYESRTRLAAGVDGAGDPVTQRKFDWAGNVIEEKSLGDATVNDGVNIDRVVTTGYDGANRVETVTDSEGGQTDYVRDDRGNVTQQTVRIDGSNSAVTNTLYDALSRAIQITDPQNSTGGRPDHIRRYDSRGNLLRETARDAADNPVLTTVFGYDNAGRQTRQAVLANPTGWATLPSVTTDRVVDMEYDADGRVQYRTTYNNNSATSLTTVTTYDSLGRVNTVTDPSSSFTDENYAPNGQLSQRTVNDGLGSRVFTFGYDDHDRVETQTAIGTPNLVTTFFYDGLNRQTYVYDPKGIASRTDYDLAGRRIVLVEDEGGAGERVTEFAYNRLSQLITQTAENATSAGAPLTDQVTTYRYDTLGRQRRAIYPDSTNVNPPETCTDCVRTEYDDAGRMTTRTDQRNLTTAYTYDDRGLPLTRTTGTTLDTWDHDAVGRPVLADRGTTGNPTAVSHTVFAYTGLGDLDYETQTLAGGTPRTIDYGHDQAGNRTSVTYPSGEALAYVPTALNQVDAVSLNASPLLDYSYAGQRLDKRRTTTNDGINTTVYEVGWGYDDHRRINGIDNLLEVNATPQTVAAYAFSHDNNGNPLSQTASGTPDFAADDRSFTVDTLNRLTDTFYADTGTTESSVFDRVGNRESHTDRAGATTNYALANTANEYSTIGGQPVTYDAAGNLTVDEAGRRYSYDERNRLTQVQAPAPDNTIYAAYSYDALGRRVTATIGATTTRYYYDGQNVIEEREGAGHPGRRTRTRPHLRHHDIKSPDDWQASGPTLRSEPDHHHV